MAVSNKCSNLTQVDFSLCLLCSAGHEWANADHRVASSGGLCRQLVWKGEVSTGAMLLTKQYWMPFFFLADWLSHVHCSCLDSFLNQVLI